MNVVVAPATFPALSLCSAEAVYVPRGRAAGSEAPQVPLPRRLDETVQSGSPLVSAPG